jgi:hypothetical protein
VHLKRNITFYFLALIVFLASFRGTDASSEALTYSVPGYIEIVQRLSTYIIILLMFISIIISYKEKLTFQKYYKDAICYFIFFVILILSGENTIEEMSLRIFFSLITLLYFVRVVSKMELRSVFLFFSIASFLFTLTNFLAYFLFPSTIWNGRLFGVTNHPNFVGIAATVSGAFAFFYIVNYPLFKVKLMYVFILIISTSVCFFSGSRNSIFSLLVAVIVCLFLKIKSFEIKIILSFLSLLSLLYLLNIEFSIGSLDYEKRGNTRAETWKILIDDVLEFPIFGKGKVGVTANSYLFAIVASGFIGFYFLIRSITGFLYRLSLQTSKLNAYYPLFCMITASLLFAAIFEGFLLDQIGVSVFAFWLILVLPLNKQKHDKIIRF